VHRVLHSLQLLLGNSGLYITYSQERVAQTEMPGVLQWNLDVEYSQDFACFNAVLLVRSSLLS
jgi:hypothetical protein